MSTLILDKFVICTDRKIKQKCQICSSSFKLGRAQHMCKRCCRAVCDVCSPYKVKCYMSDYKNGLHRMCKKCHLESEALGKYVKSNHIKWGEDSDLVRIWLKKMGLKTTPKRKNPQKRRNKQEIAFMEMWLSLNFSFREFIGMVIDEAKASQTLVQDLINSTFAELSSSKEVEPEHTIYILLFFLAHCSAHNAVYFASIVIQAIEAEEITMDNVHSFLEQMNCIPIEISKMENIIQVSYEKMMKQATINVFTAEISIEVINFFFSHREFQEFEKGVAYVFSERKQFVLQHSNKPQDVLIDILRNVSSSNYRKVTKALEKHQQKVTSLTPKDSASQSQIMIGSSKSIQSPKFNQQKINHILRQNQQLKALVRSQQFQIRKLRDENQKILTQNQLSSKSQKKTSSMNLKLQLSNFRESHLKQKNDGSTSEQSNDESYNYADFIQKKNQQIIRLKNQLTSLKEKASDTQSKLNSASENESDLKKSSRVSLKQKRQKDEIQKLKEEIQILKGVNKNMHKKFHQLANLMMDKQQKMLKESDQNFQMYISQGITKQNMQKECRIF